MLLKEKLIHPNQAFSRRIQVLDKGKTICNPGLSHQTLLLTFMYLEYNTTSNKQIEGRHKQIDI